MAAAGRLPSRAFSLPAATPQGGLLGTLPVARGRLLLGIVDLGLAACIFLVPLLMGGRHPLGQGVLVAAAAASAAAWTARESFRPHPTWRRTAILPLVLLGMLLVAIQLVPLPQPVLRLLSPRALELLPLWTPAGDGTPRLGAWSTVSLAPAETRAGLVIFAAYGLLALVSVQRIQTIGDLERLLRWCALAAAIMAGFGLIQFLAGNGRFFWFYEHPFSTTADAVKGSFANRNHFAQFLALGIGPLVWWLHDACQQGRSRPERLPARTPRGRTTARKTRKPAPGEFSFSARDFSGGNRAAALLVLALATVLFAGLLSLSRGGIVAMLLAALVAAAVLAHRSSARAKVMAGLAAAGLGIAVALAIFGYERVSRRLEDLSSASVQRLDPVEARRAIWTAVLKAIPHHLLLGSGVGSHRTVYPTYFDVPSCESEFTHAENGYLQVTLETGLPGLGLLAAGLGMAAFWCVAGLRRAASDRAAACLGAVAAGLAANAAHAAVDFVWYVPGCTAIVAILAGGALRAYQLAGRPSPQTAGHRDIGVPRPAMAAAAVAVTVAGVWMTGNRIAPVLAEPDWHQFLLLEAARRWQPWQSPQAAGAEAEPPSAAAIEAQRERIARLERVVLRQPDHARAHLELARAYLGLFDMSQVAADNSMSLANLRDAAMASQFSSREALCEWLSRAVGDPRLLLDRALRHTREALALCPLEGEGYLFLAKLCFLDGSGLSQAACVDQALRVRPFDGAVLYEAAVEAWLAGDTARWLERLRGACRSGRKQQEHVLRRMIAYTPPEGIDAVLELITGQLDPDLEGLRFLHTLAAQRARPGQLAPLRQLYVRRIEAAAQVAQGPQAASLWLEALPVHRERCDPAEALQCARRAQACHPDSYDAHHLLVRCLVEQGELAEAEGQLRWCLQRRPGDEALQRLAKDLLRKRLDRSRQDHAQRPGTMR